MKRSKKSAREGASPARHAARGAVSIGPALHNDAADAFVRERKDLAIDEIAQAFLAPQRIPLVRPLAIAVPLPEAIAWLHRMGEYALGEGFARTALYPWFRRARIRRGLRGRVARGREALLS